MHWLVLGITLAGALCATWGAYILFTPSSHYGNPINDLHPTFAVVDCTRIILESPRWKTFQKEQSKQEDDYRKVFDEEQRRINTLSDELEKQRSSLSTDELAEKKKNLYERLEQLKVNMDSFEQQIQMRRDEKISNLQNQLANVMDRYFESKKILFAMDKQFVLVYPPTWDHTAQLKTIFNEASTLTRSE